MPKEKGKKENDPNNWIVVEQDGSEQEVGNIDYDRISQDLIGRYEEIAETQVQNIAAYFGKETPKENKEVDDYLDLLMDVWEHKNQLTRANQDGIRKIVRHGMLPDDERNPDHGKGNFLNSLQIELQNRTLELMAKAGSHPSKEQLQTAKRYIDFLDDMVNIGGAADNEQKKKNQQALEEGLQNEKELFTNENSYLFEAIPVFMAEADLAQDSSYFENYYRVYEDLKKPVTKETKWKAEFLEKRRESIERTLKEKEKELEDLNRTIKGRENDIQQYHDDYEKYTTDVQAFKSRNNREIQGIYDLAESIEKNIKALEGTTKADQSEEFGNMLKGLRELKESDPETGKKKSVFDSISHPKNSETSIFNEGVGAECGDFMKKIDALAPLIKEYVDQKANKTNRLIGNGKTRYKASVKLQKDLKELKNHLDGYQFFKAGGGNLKVLKERRSLAELIQCNTGLLNGEKEQAANLTKEIEDLKADLKTYGGSGKTQISFKDVEKKEKGEEKQERNRSKSLVLKTSEKAKNDQPSRSKSF